jgi:lipopolysaccharide/colanic/teichoic acid biosynthesis glycosyltransferase
MSPDHPSTWSAANGAGVAAVPRPRRRKRDSTSEHPGIALGALGAALEEGCEERIQDEEARCDRDGLPMSVLTLDRLGAPGAERVGLAGLRATDIVAPIGPDSARILLPFTGAEGARRALARITLDADCSTSAAHVSIQTPDDLAEWDVPALDPRTGSVECGPSHSALPPGIRWEERGVALLMASGLPRWKRALDVLLAGGALIALAPLLLSVALLVWLTAGRPILFRQWRTGRAFRRFQIYKFRTMRTSLVPGWDEVRHLNEMSGPLFKSDQDPRVLRLGKWLRRTSLDELPQLVNVLKGDMTLVGPRALSPEPEEYETWQLRRFDVTPGIACAWQAAHRSDTDFEAWMRSDLGYSERAPTLAGDLGLLARIVWGVLRCRGGR